MSNKINIGSIVKAHFQTLKDQNSNKLDIVDLLIFFLLPIALSAILIFGFDFDLFAYKEMIKSLVAGLAIFVGLLFNALVMIINLFKTNGDHTNDLKDEIILELIPNISFAILLAFIGVFLTLFRFWDFNNISWFARLFDFIIFFLLISFFLTFLMVLKRTYAVIISD